MITFWFESFALDNLMQEERINKTFQNGSLMFVCLFSSWKRKIKQTFSSHIYVAAETLYQWESRVDENGIRSKNNCTQMSNFLMGYTVNRHLFCLQSKNSKRLNEKMGFDLCTASNLINNTCYREHYCAACWIYASEYSGVSNSSTQFRSYSKKCLVRKYRFRVKWENNEFLFLQSNWQINFKREHLLKFSFRFCIKRLWSVWESGWFWSAY